MIPLLVRSLPGRGTILCYHGFTTPALPSRSLVNLPLELFLGHLDAIARVATVVPLRDLLDRHRSGRSTSGMVALTFDDAYASLLSLEPILRAKRVPLTVFAVSGALEQGSAFWWDRLEDLYPRLSPDQWRELERTLGVPAEYRSGQPAEFGPLRPLRQWLLARFAGRLPPSGVAAVAGLESRVGAATCQRSMSWEELQQFATVPGVEVGVHTRTHPVLPLLSSGDAESEIAGCYADLRQRLPAVAPVLAVPYGLLDGRSAGLARRAGLRDILSLRPRRLAAGDGPEWPRFCLTNREPGWKLMLRVLGVADRLPGSTEERTRYPALPSASS